jgi:spermidine synthase
MSQPAPYKWFFETTTPVEGHMHAIARTVAARQTKFQLMEILDTLSYGRCLVLDGRIQSSEADEFIYHEVLVQPGLLAHPAPRRAMVIGGGEGATVREILRHRGITDCLMVDIDDEVVKECREHLSAMHRGAFDDPRTRLLHEDARAYLEHTSERFDLIVVDLVEPLEAGPACLLFTREFYSLVRDRLTEGGVMTMQAGMTKVNELAFYAAVHRTLREVFPVVAPYQAFISCYGTPWGFMLASKGVDPRSQTAAEVDRLIATRMSPAELGYWDGQAHLHSFNLPKFIRQALDRTDRVITDANPLIFS